MQYLRPYLSRSAAKEPRRSRRRRLRADDRHAHSQPASELPTRKSQGGCMHKYFRLAALIGVALCCGWTTGHAQSNFYEGKTIRMIVGFTAGGGYDAYTRTVGRHLGKHIPGHPAVIVENMPGAGSMISANYIYKAAKPDGLTIGHFIG